MTESHGQQQEREISGRKFVATIVFVVAVMAIAVSGYVFTNKPADDHPPAESTSSLPTVSRDRVMTGLAVLAGVLLVGGVPVFVSVRKARDRRLH